MCYCSPEVCRGEAYNQKTDVWALGCIIYEMSLRKKCFEGYNDENIKQKIVQYSCPGFPDKYSKDL